MAELDPAAPVVLADAVDYQAGGIVSRVLSKTDGGSLTLFAFDAGEALSEHTAPFEAIVHVLEGRAEVTIAGTAHAVPAGAVIRMPAHVPHALQAPERFKMALVMLRA